MPKNTLLIILYHLPELGKYIQTKRQWNRLAREYLYLTSSSGKSIVSMEKSQYCN
jgi:hypothetical protein